MVCQKKKKGMNEDVWLRRYSFFITKGTRTNDSQFGATVKIKN